MFLQVKKMFMCDITRNLQHLRWPNRILTLINYSSSDLKMSVILRQKKGPSWRASATAMARMSILIRLFQFSAASSVILRSLGMRIKHKIGWLPL